MAERLKQQPKAYVLGQTETIKGRKTRFELLLAGSTNKTLQKDDYRLKRLEGFEVWEVDQDKIFFKSPFSGGVLVCDVKRDKKRSIKVQDDTEEFTAYTVGSHADSWFNNLLNTSDLRIVARPVPNQR